MTEDELDRIDRAFADGTAIDEGIEDGVRAALRSHKRAGNPIVIWREGQIQWIAPEDIPVVDEPSLLYDDGK